MIPILIPDMPSTEELLPWLKQIDANLHYTNFGPLNKQFEQALLKYYTVANLHITTVANATLGLELALQALDLPKGTKVLLPAITFVATATAVIRAGFVPVIADTDEQNWLLTPAIAREALKKYSYSAIMPVASFGTPQDTVAWDKFNEETGIPVIIDAAGAFDNQPAAQRATVIFSLHATKCLGAGEGGFILSTNKSLIEKIRHLCNFGIDPTSGNTVYAGTNAKLSEYHAAVGLASLQRWDENKNRRLALLKHYREILSGLGEQIIFQAQGENNINSLLVIRITQQDNMETIIKQLNNSGVGTRRWYYPLICDHPAFNQYECAGDLKTSRVLAKQLVGLPFYPQLTAEQLNKIAAALKQALVTTVTA